MSAKTLYMKKIILLLSVTVIILKLNAQAPVDNGIANILQQKLDNCVNTYNIPGISATILLPGNKYWSGASGVSDIYTLDPMDTSLLFYQASVTKTFVAAIVFQLIEENKLSLDHNIGMYLSTIRTIPPSTKIRYLLNQRSGIYNFIGGNPSATSTWFSHPDSIWTSKRAIETYNHNPNFTQGTAFEYSNTNYILLGMIVEKITGNTFAEELKNRILIPFGLNQTFLPHIDSIAGPLVQGWTSFTQNNIFDTNASQILNNCFASMSFTAGALVSYPKDVAKFYRLLFSGQIIHDTTLQVMKTCANVNFAGSNGYGYGLMRYNFGGKTYFGHVGDLSGFTQLTIHQESDSITLSISINRNHAARIQIASAMLKALQEALELGMDESNNSDNFYSLYPNPTKGIVKIDFIDSQSTNYQLEVYDQLGKQIYNEGLNNFTHNHYCIDLSSFPNNIYFVKLSSDTHCSIKKVILNKLILS